MEYVFVESWEVVFSPFRLFDEKRLKFNLDFCKCPSVYFYGARYWRVGYAAAFKKELF